MYRLLNGYILEFSDDGGETWMEVCQVKWTNDSHSIQFFNMIEQANIGYKSSIE